MNMSSMATPAAETVHVVPPVIILRPSWLDLPASRLVSRITLIAICAIFGTIILTITVRITWRPL